jgi:hypothetical protein
VHRNYCCRSDVELIIFHLWRLYDHGDDEEARVGMSISMDMDRPLIDSGAKRKLGFPPDADRAESATGAVEAMEIFVLALRLMLAE